MVFISLIMYINIIDRKRGEEFVEFIFRSYNFFCFIFVFSIL